MEVLRRIGLIDAADRYDEDRGIKFETFAERRIRGARQSLHVHEAGAMRRRQLTL